MSFSCDPEWSSISNTIREGTGQFPAQLQKSYRNDWDEDKNDEIYTARSAKAEK